MKKIKFLLKLLVFLFVTQIFSQSQEIKTMYTMDGKSKGGGYENIIFKIYNERIVKEDVYYGKSSSYAVKLKKHSYNEANEYVETYQTSLDYDDLDDLSVDNFHAFFIFYTSKGGKVLGVQHKKIKSNKMYFTKYGYESR